MQEKEINSGGYLIKEKVYGSFNVHVQYTYTFELWQKKPYPEIIMGIDITAYGDTKDCHLGKLEIYKDELGNYRTTLTLDLLRYHFEKRLYKDGFRSIEGSTNATLAGKLKKRGWSVEGRAVEKRLEPTNNPEPLLWVRSRRRNERKAKRKKPKAKIRTLAVRRKRL